MIHETLCFTKYLLKLILKYSSNIQALVISTGTIIGGIWTYLLYVKQRLHYPKLDLNMEINEVNLKNGKKLIHVEIGIKNIGNTLFNSTYSELRLRQILPIEDKELLNSITEGLDPVKKNNTNLEWPCFALREWNNSIEIEPGEADTLHADFFIGNTIQAAEFYFYLKNAKKQNLLGWPITKIYKFKPEE